MAAGAEHLVTSLLLLNHLTTIRAVLGILADILSSLQILLLAMMVLSGGLNLIAIRADLGLANITLPGSREPSLAGILDAPADELLLRLLDCGFASTRKNTRINGSTDGIIAICNFTQLMLQLSDELVELSTLAVETLTLLLQRDKCHSSRQITLLAVPENFTTLLDILTTHKGLGEIGIQKLPVIRMLAMHTMRVLNGLANVALSASMASGILALRALHLSAHFSILLNTHRALVHEILLCTTSRNFFSGSSNRFSCNRRHSMGLETDRAWSLKWLGLVSRGQLSKKRTGVFNFFAIF
jgi:hypothetical protein